MLNFRIRPRLKKSVIWDYFDRMNSSYNVCRLCTAKVKATGGCTKGCLYHLKTKHGNQPPEAVRKKADENCDDITPSYSDTNTGSPVFTTGAVSDQCAQTATNAEDPVPTAVAVSDQYAVPAAATASQFKFKMLPSTSNTTV